MLLAGLGVTLAVALSAGILGTLLAYGLVFVRKRNRKIFNSLIAVYTRLIAGIPGNDADGGCLRSFRGNGSPGSGG